MSRYRWYENRADQLRDLALAPLAWHGPYTVRWDDANLLTETGRVLFVPTPGMILLGYATIVRESYLSPTDEVPRLAVGTWADAAEDILGSDNDISVDVGTPLWSGTDVLRPMVDGSSNPSLPSGIFHLFLTDSPVMVNCVDGDLDADHIEKPDPPCQALTAGIADLYFLIGTPIGPS